MGRYWWITLLIGMLMISMSMHAQNGDDCQLRCDEQGCYDPCEPACWAIIDGWWTFICNPEYDDYFDDTNNEEGPSDPQPDVDTSGQPLGDSGGGSWPGYTDGRLNPDPAEYYSIWCRSGQIEIWRAVPAASIVKSVSVFDALALPIGGTADLGDNMALVRNSDTVATIYGSNGNNAPEPGSKSFSLDQCAGGQLQTQMQQAPAPTPIPAPSDDTRSDTSSDSPTNLGELGEFMLGWLCSSISVVISMAVGAPTLWHVLRRQRTRRADYEREL